MVVYINGLLHTSFEGVVVHLFQYTWARPPSPSICYEFQTVAIRSMRLLNSLKNLVLHLCKVYFQEPFYSPGLASQNVKSNDLGQIILKYFRAIFYTMICLPQCLEGFPQSHLVWINASSLS